MLSLFLLGSPQVFWEHRAVNEMTSMKSQALLFYLALNRRAQSRLRMAGLLWPERSELEGACQLASGALPVTPIVARSIQSQPEYAGPE